MTKKLIADPINAMRLELSAQSINESFARTTVAAFASQLDPTLDEINDIKTAVSEAVTNAIVHAYGEGIIKLKGVHLPSTDYTMPTIVIEAELFNDSIRIKVTDKGKGINDIEQAMQPFHTTKPEEERSGMGFTVMQSFMDNLNVSSRPNKGTTITMQKFFVKNSTPKENAV
ncbi:MAG: anti-sigma F factor [Firmicutes bacterium]|nr:anti-sigma F factor [Bacillota bacterium]